MPIDEKNDNLTFNFIIGTYIWSKMKSEYLIGKGDNNNFINL